MKFSREEMQKVLEKMPKKEIISIALDYREGYFSMVKKYQKELKKKKTEDSKKCNGLSGK